MVRIFWVKCPKCGGRFYAEYYQFRHKAVKLLCPYCQHRFLDSESPEVDDRWP